MPHSSKTKNVSNYTPLNDKGIIKCRLNNLSLRKVSSSISLNISHNFNSRKTSINHITLKTNMRLKEIKIKPSGFVEEYDKYKITLYFKRKKLDIKLLIACYYDTHDNDRYWFKIKFNCHRLSTKSVQERTIPITYKQTTTFKLSRLIQKIYHLSLPTCLINDIFDYAKDDILNGYDHDLSYYFDKHYDLYGTPFITNLSQLTNIDYLTDKLCECTKNNQDEIDTIKYVLNRDINRIQTDYNVFPLKIMINLKTNLLENSDYSYLYSLLVNKYNMKIYNSVNSNVVIGDTWFLNKISQLHQLKNLCVDIQQYMEHDHIVTIEAKLLFRGLKYSNNDILMLWFNEKKETTNTPWKKKYAPLVWVKSDETNNRTETTKSALTNTELLNSFGVLLCDPAGIGKTFRRAFLSRKTASITFYDDIGGANVARNDAETSCVKQHMAKGMRWQNKIKHKQPKLYFNRKLRFKYHRW